MSGGNYVLKGSVTLDPRGATEGANTARQAVGSIGQAADQSTTKMQRLVNQTTGIKTAVQPTREWTGALAGQSLAVDALRAKYNPLFATIQQYRDHLAEIRTAHAQGALSADEMTAAISRQRRVALQTISTLKGRPGETLHALGPNKMHTANLAAQGNDIMMMAAMGQNPMMLALQQGTQVSQVLNQMGSGKQVLNGLAAGFMSMVNPVSLATIGIIAFGAAGLQGISSLLPETKSLDDALADLGSGVDSYRKLSEAARRSTQEMAAEFGSASAMGRELLGMLAQVERRRDGRAAGDAIKAMTSEIRGGSFFGLRDERTQFATLQRLFDERSWLTSGFGMNKEDSPLTFATSAALNQLKSADDIDAQIKAADELQKAFIAAVESSGEISKEEDEWLEKIGLLRQELLKLQAIDENARGKVQADSLIRDLEREAELRGDIARYGEESAEADRVRAAQARDKLARELDDLDIAQDDPRRRRAQDALAAIERARQDEELRVRRQSIADIKAETDLRSRLEAQVVAGILSRREANEQLQIEMQLRPLILSAAKADADQRQRLTALIVEQRRAMQALSETERQAEREQALRELRSDAISAQFDSAARSARDPVSRAALEAQREYIRLVAQGTDTDIAAAKAAQIRGDAIAETVDATRTQIADMLDELEIRKQVSAGVVAGTVARSDEARVIREELVLRPLLAAAARAEGDEKRRLTEVIDGLRGTYAATAAEGRRQAANEYMRTQAEQQQQLRVETALLGQNETVRNRVLTLIEAERRIRELGLNTQSSAAQHIRDEARAIADGTSELRKRAEAWGDVQQAAEGAIDGMVDKLFDGDWKGALTSIEEEIKGLFTELAVKNPLKNLILGTDYATMHDAGGLGGIVGRLFGQNPLDESSVITQGAQRVQAMTISAAQVTINAAGLGQPGLGSYTGMSGIAMGSAGIGALGGGDVPSQIWQFFAAKGLAPHQIAAIVGNVHAESGFNPLATGDGGNAHGLFQWNDRRHELFDFIGGKQNLGDIQKQLEFAWHEMMTSENGSFKRLMSSGNVLDATKAFIGFERPFGWSQANPEAGHNFTGRLATAQKALEQFELATISTKGDLSELGQGFGGLGGIIAQLLNGMSGTPFNPGSGGGGIFGDILGSVLPGFDGGGATGGTDPSRVAGLVHEGEFVFNADATRRIGVRNLEVLHSGKMPGYQIGGYASRLPAEFGRHVQNDASGSVNIAVYDKVGTRVEAREDRDPDGGRRVSLVIGERIAQAVSEPGNPAARSLRNAYGLKRQGRVR